MIRTIIFFILVFSNFMLHSQGMYLDRNEPKRAYSIVGSYIKNAEYHSEYISSLGISAVFKGKHELEYLYHKYSDRDNNFNISYTYYSKFNSNMNIFLGSSLQYANSMNDNPNYSCKYGINTKFSDEELTFFPFIYRMKYYDDDTIQYYDSIGLSILFYDIGLQPEFIVYDNGSTYYQIKFYLWEFQ